MIETSAAPSSPNPADAADPVRAARAERRKQRFRWVRRVGRVLLLVAGVAAIVLLVHEAGPEGVLRTLLTAAPWLPLVVLLEGGFMAADVFALRSILGEHGKNVPAGVWIRSALVAYGVMQLLPAGRAGAELARAAALSPFIGGARATALAARLQAATLLGNTAISVPCYIAVAVASNAHSALGYAVLVNGLVTLAIGVAIILASQRARVGGWLGKRFGALASHGPSFDSALREEAHWPRAVIATTLGRLVQTLQYGVILLAVGGSLTVVSAFVSQGIHLVGAGMGDMVPNQVGITEGAYRLFADSLGLGNRPDRAIGIALVARICQFSLAGVSLVISSLWKIAPPKGGRPRSTAPDAIEPTANR